MPADKLFEPTRLGDLQLRNRIVYPAMTRARCAGNVVNGEVVKYYAARATAGLIVAEPSFISAQAVGYNDTPALFSETHVRGWKAVTDAVHAEGGTIVAQLWHTGRMSHSSFHGGAQIVAPSALRIEDVNGVPACGVQGIDGQWHAHEVPRALSTAEVAQIVADFGRAAALAKAAGFDGVELHAGSGYLLDTFLQACSNTRSDKYGGDAEGRFTILAEVLAAVSTAFPPSRVGIKLSPNNGFNGMGARDTFATFKHVAARLRDAGVAYLHVVDGVGMGAKNSWYGRVDSSGFHNCSMPLTLANLKATFGSCLIGNGGYTLESAKAKVDADEAAAISFGRVYMANPDLVRRFREGLPLAPLPPKAAWFEPTEATRAEPSKGYTEYGPHADAPKRGMAVSPSNSMDLDETPRKTVVLHLLGSPTSTYYEELSLMYAQGCASVHDDGEFAFVFAMVHPGSRMSFPSDLSDGARAVARKMPVAQAVGVLATLGADVCQSHMFCALGVTTYRAMLDLLHIPFVGGSVDAMALTMHKGKTRAVVAEAGVPVADGEVLREGMTPSLPVPYILKPCSEDNSMGLGVVRHESEMQSKLADAFDFDDEVLCERFIPPGRELRVAVLEDDDGKPTLTLPAIEYFLSAEKPVRTSNDKTQVDSNGKPLKFAKPAREVDCALDAALRAKLVDAVTKAHVALGCRDYSLYDFRVDTEGNIFFLEASLFCCFAPNSVICLMADATGRPELRPTNLFKTMVHRALDRRVDVSEVGLQTMGSKPKSSHLPKKSKFGGALPPDEPLSDSLPEAPLTPATPVAVA